MEKSYNLPGILNDDVAIDSFIDTNDGYISDAISEIAGALTSTSSADLWENAPKIQEYIEEAIDEGIAGNRLTGMFAAGECVYYERLLHDNLEALVYNWALNYIDENELYVDLEYLEDSLPSYPSKFSEIEAVIDDSKIQQDHDIKFCENCNTVLEQYDEFQCEDCIDAENLEVIGVYGMSNNTSINVYKIMHDDGMSVIAGYNGDKPELCKVTEATEPHFKFGKIEVPLNGVMRV